MLPLNPPGSPLFRDHLDSRVGSWIRPWDGVARPDVLLVGAPLSRTSISHSGASGTPQAMREMFSAVSTYNLDHELDLATVLSAADAGDALVHVTDSARSRAGIRNAVSAVLAASPASTLVVMGGDHSITAPCVEAFREHVSGPVGLVQLDSHMDLRNLDDGGPTNGTPIRQLLDSKTLDGRNIVQAGLQSFANARAYHEVAKEAGITQITATEIAASDARVIARRALAVASANTESVYVTLDMDVLDQAFAPGAPALVPGGLTSRQLLDMMLVLGSDPKVRALDIVEVDPTQDPRRATVRVAVYAMLTFLTGVALRRGTA